MEDKSTSNRLGLLFTVLVSIAAFVMASGKIFGTQPVTFKLFAILVPVLGFISYWMLKGSPLKRQLGLGLVINGMAFWGIGWMLIILVEPVVGWWVYIAGWMTLSIGFVIYGAVEANKRGLPNYVVAILLLGLLPVMAEFASPYRFATELKAGSQLLVMFAYSFGWIMIGYVMKNLPVSVHQLEKLPTQLMPQPNE